MSFLFLFLIALFLLRRKIDTFFVAGMGIGVYFFPAFLGYLYYMDLAANFLLQGKLASTEMQISILSVLLFLYLCSLVYDMVFGRSIGFRLYKLNDNAFSLAVLVFCFIVSVYAVPVALQVQGKNARVGSIGYVSYFFDYSYYFGILISCYWVYALRQRFNRALVVAFAFLSLLVFVSVIVFQTRSIAFFSILSVFLYVIYGERLRLRHFNIKYLLFVFLMIVVLVGKHISNVLIYDVVYDDWLLVLKDSLESFGVSSNLNYVYESGLYNFYFDTSFLSLFPGSGILGFGPVDYHDLIKEKVFPAAQYGMGGNPFGEAWVNARWYGIGFYGIYIVTKCVVLDLLIKSSASILKCFFIMLSFFTLFYCNRNSVLWDISFLRNFFIFFLFFLFLSYLFSSSYLLKKVRDD